MMPLLTNGVVHAFLKQCAPQWPVCGYRLAVWSMIHIKLDT